MKKHILYTVVIASILTACHPPTKEKPLSEWNDSTIKHKIIAFVTKVSTPGTDDFVAPEERIAVFDNDGTLWNEKPLYIPVEIEIAYIKSKYATKKEWQDDKLYTSLAHNDLSEMRDYGTKELIQKLFAAHDGQPEEEYKQEVYKYLSNTMHRDHNRPLKEMTYAPMVQLIHYLQKNNFKVYIVTGGEITSVRTISEEIYNIPKENIIGSSVAYEYITSQNNQYIIRKGKINSANDKHIKPTNIELHIGRQPIFAAGNSDGDYQMMEYTLANKLPSMAILVHHDDEEREYKYMHGTEQAISDAKEKGWDIVSMENDFKNIWFPIK